MYEIKLKIHEERDLYNKLDPEQMILADDVVNYLNRRYKERDDVDGICLHIISNIPLMRKG